MITFILFWFVGFFLSGLRSKMPQPTEALTRPCETSKSAVVAGMVMNFPFEFITKKKNAYFLSLNKILLSF